MTPTRAALTAEYVQTLLARIDELEERVRTLEPDAKRFDWLLSGNGYFMEESSLCGHGNPDDDEKNEARRIIDNAMKGVYP